jgi:ATP-binding cassette, subfamily G (WHITE), member 2, PDR
MLGDTAGFQLQDKSALSSQGMSYSRFHNSCKGERIYLAELDVHFPELTLGQTLRFAVSMRQTNADTEPRAYQAASHFGLAHRLDTQMRDALNRGLSGGEKRRASIAEAYLGSAQLQCWDNSTGGLDSLTASRLIKFLQTIAVSRKANIAMSIY